MAPPDERLHGGRLTRRKVADRLVLEHEALSSTALLQIALQRVAAHNGRVKLRLEDREAALAVGLGRVHGHVRVAHERLGTVARPAADGDADAAVNARARCRRRSNGARNASRIRSAMSTRPPPSAIRDRTPNSSPPRRTARSWVVWHAAQALADGAQQLIAGGMAERVVDGLEVVKIDEQDRRPHRAAATSALERLARAAPGTGHGCPGRSARRDRPGGAAAP